MCLNMPSSTEILWFLWSLVTLKIIWMCKDYKLTYDSGTNCNNKLEVNTHDHGWYSKYCTVSQQRHWPVRTDASWKQQGQPCVWLGISSAYTWVWMKPHFSRHGLTKVPVSLSQFNCASRMNMNFVLRFVIDTLRRIWKKYNVWLWPSERFSSILEDFTWHSEQLRIMHQMMQ